jgi:hypothetical protein
MQFIFLGAIAAFVAFFLYAAIVVGRRLFRDDGRLRLVEAVRGQGRVLPEPENEAAGHGIARAARRCVACAAHAQCDELLAARDWKALRAICPNTDYIELLAAPSR